MERQTITGRLSTSGRLSGRLSTAGRLSGALSVGGGTTDYNELENKPTYNGHVIEGAMTSESLSIWQPVDFSTTEQNTGLKWIDGRDIYNITYELINVNIPSNSYYTIDTLSNITILYAFGCVKEGNSKYLISDSNLRIVMINGDLRLNVPRDASWSISKGHVIIYYIKNS